jgi:hypothetical protein
MQKLNKFKEAQRHKIRTDNLKPNPATILKLELVIYRKRGYLQLKKTYNNPKNGTDTREIT